MATPDKVNSVIVQEQAKSLLRMAYGYRHNLDSLKKNLAKYTGSENRSFSAESIAMVAAHMKNNPDKFPLPLQEIVNNFFVGKVAEFKETRKENQISTNANPQKIQKEYDKVLDYIKEHNRVPDNLDLFMKKAIDNKNLEEIRYIKTLNEDSNRQISINGDSPLEYAFKVEKNDLAVQMMREGFTLNPRSKAKSTEVNAAIKNIIERKEKGNALQTILTPGIKKQGIVR